jgi:hypothetical protein
MRWGRSVPMFLDRHAVDDVNPVVLYLVHLEADSGWRDGSGTKPIGQWLADGAIHCLLEAPDVEALHRHHNARDLGCGEVYPVVGLSGELPLTTSDLAIVRSEIARIWYVAPHRYTGSPLPTPGATGRRHRLRSARARPAARTSGNAQSRYSGPRE